MVVRGLRKEGSGFRKTEAEEGGRREGESAGTDRLDRHRGARVRNADDGDEAASCNGGAGAASQGSRILAAWRNRRSGRGPLGQRRTSHLPLSRPSSR